MNTVEQFKNSHRWLSNMALVPVVLDGITYPSVENAYQASKTLDLKTRERFVDANPYESKAMGKRVNPFRNDWNSARIGVMTDLVRQKMNQEPFKSRLLSTGSALLQEGNTWKDYFWGVDLKTKVGSNNLGLIIMAIRKELQDIEYLDSVVAKHGHRVFAMYNAKVSDTNIYIGRGKGSILGNPFSKPNSRVENCIKYRNHMLQVVRTNSDPQLIQAIKDLKGKNVICFCSNGTDSVSKGARYCHGHIILNICEYLNKD